MGKGASKIAGGGEDVEEFDVSLLDGLPEETREKLEKISNDQQAKYDELKEKFERIKVDSEQKNFSLEKELLSRNERLEQQTKSSTELRVQVNDLEAKYQKSSEHARNLQEEMLGKSQHWGEVQLVKSQLEAEKVELSALVEKKDREISTLRDEWKTMSEKVSEANKLRLEALANLEGVQTQQTTIKYKEARLQQERDQFQQHNSWLETQLKEKSEEVLSIRKDKSSRLLDLQSQLDRKTDEVSHLEEAVESLRQTVDSQNGKIETYIQKLKDSRDAQTHIEEQYRNEVQAQEKLLTLYKASASESQAKSEELLTAVSELRGLLKQASEARTELKRQREEDVESRDETIQKLERELADANNLIGDLRKKGVVPLSDESVEALAPTAAATSRLLKSGMTLTQIYTEYVQVSENLQLEQQENQRLNVYLDQLLQEIEEKAPMLRKQREDYEKAVQTVQQLTKQLDTAMLECEKLRKSADSSNRRCGELDRDNRRFRQQTYDLSLQVRMLLKELEESRGTVVNMSPTAAANVSSSDMSSSSHIISQKLVTFRSIEELQTQNQKLLEVVRELSDNKEEEEKLSTEEKTAELKRQLEDAVGEIELMQSSREKQAEMVESIIRQRDMYKVLLAQAGGSPLPGNASPMQASTPLASQKSPQVSHVPKSPGLDKKAVEETTEALKELQEEFNIYRKEKAENEKILNAQLDEMRTKTSDMRVQNARLSSQLDFSAERYKILQSNIEGYKQEINALREKNQKLTGSLVAHEESIANLREDLMATQETLSRSEVRCQHISSEKEMLRHSEARLLQEKESMMREKQTQNLLLANLQAIQNNLERSEFETKTMLSQRIEDLEKETNILKRRKEAVDDQHKVVIDAFEARERDSRNTLTASRVELNSVQQQLQDAETQIQRLNQQLSEREADYAAAENRLSNVPDGQVHRAGQDYTVELSIKEEQIKDFKSQLYVQNTEIKALKEQLVKVTQHAEQYKQLANSLEQNLKEQNTTSQDFKDQLETKLQETTQAYEEAQSELAQIREQRQRLINENLAMTEEHQKSSAELRQQLSSAQKELQTLMDTREASLTAETSARSDLQTQSQLAEEWQDKYQRELILHAANVQALTEVKEQLNGFNQKVILAEEEAKEAQQTLETSRASWAEQEKLYQEEQSRLETRVTELQEQNSLVHQQLQTLSQQMVQLQQHQERDEEATSSLADSVARGDINKSNDQLLQVIRFLRKEKDIAEAKFEVVEAEAARIREQLSYQQKQADEANKLLTEERQKAQANLQTAAQHADLLRKVENLNLLQDSNRMLREEKERLVQQLRELEAKAKKLEEEIHPLQASVRDSQAEVQVVQAEKKALRMEADSWRNRTSQLIESYNKTDPEEVKRIMAEKEQTTKQITTLKEENAKQRAEVLKLNSQLSTLQSQLNRTKLQLEQQKQSTSTINTTLEIKDKEMEELKSTSNTKLETKDKEMEEKSKTIAQLRKIGRKYRVQAEDAQKQLQEEKESAEQKQNQVNAELTAAQEQLKEKEAAQSELQEKLKISEQSLQVAESKIGELQKSLDSGVKPASEKARLAEEKCLIAENKIRAIEDKVKLAEDKAKTAEEKAQQGEESLKAAKAESAELTEQLGALQVEKNLATKQLKEEEGKMAALNQEIGQLKQEISKVKESETKFKGERDEMDKKQKLLIQRVNERIKEYKNKLEKSNAEKEELKQELASGTAGVSDQQTAEEAEHRVAAVKSQLEARISSLEKELEDAKQQQATPVEADDAATTQVQQELDKLKKENAELVQKIQQLQKNLEDQQKPAQPSATKPTISAAPSTTSAEPPKMANILPRQQAAGTRHHQPIQPMRGSAADTRAMASVRPLAVSPMGAGTSAMTATTPTATVMPTTVSVPEGESIPPPVVSISPASASQSRPTQQVQPVPPHVEDITEEAMDEPVIDESTAPSHTPVVESEPAPSTSTSTGATSETPTGTKRPREEPEIEEVPDDEAPVKRTKVQEAEAAQAAAAAAVASSSLEQPPATAVIEPDSQTVEPEQVQPGTSVEPVSVQEELQEETASTQENLDEGDEPQEEVLETMESAIIDLQELAAEDDDDVICVDEEDEDQGYGIEEYAEDEEEEGENVGEEEDEEGEEEEEEFDSYQGEDREEQEETEEAEGMQAETRHADADVVILDDDDDDDEEDNDVEAEVGAVEVPEAQQASTSTQQGSQSQSSSSQEVQQLTVSSSRPVPPQLGRMPSQVDRQLSVGRSQQLTPFTLGADGGFELGDDGIVPCTPTLIVPRRTDGFAEAVSSPSVHQRFIFGSGGETSPFEPGLESQEALGMDDTRVDLSQFDDRGVPTSSAATPATSTTPQARTTPTISVTEASPPPVEEQQGEEETEEDPISSEMQTGTAAVESHSEAIEEDFSDGPAVELTESAAASSEEKQQTTAEADAEEADQGYTEVEAAPSTSTDSQASTGFKPKIQRIVWDAPESSSPVTPLQQTPPMAHPQPPQQQQQQQQQQHQQQQQQQQPSGTASRPMHQRPRYPRGTPMRGRPQQQHQQHQQQQQQHFQAQQQQQPGQPIQRLGQQRMVRGRGRGARGSPVGMRGGPPMHPRGGAGMRGAPYRGHRQPPF